VKKKVVCKLELERNCDGNHLLALRNRNNCSIKSFHDCSSHLDHLRANLNKSRYFQPNKHSSRLHQLYIRHIMHPPQKAESAIIRANCRLLLSYFLAISKYTHGLLLFSYFLTIRPCAKIWQLITLAKHGRCFGLSVSVCYNI
jgi:hypothetical protein